MLWKYLPLHLLMNAGSVLAFALKGQGGALWRAKRDALKGLPRALKARRAIQRARTAPATDIERRMARGLRLLGSRGATP
ncbi:hypothetical protein D3C87_2112970 [compost metagenome]